MAIEQTDLFRNLNGTEGLLFRQWARNNYKPGAEIPSTWHPAVRAECVQINREFGFERPGSARLSRPAHRSGGALGAAIRPHGR